LAVVVSPDPLSPTPSTFSTVKTYDPQFFPHPSASLVETEEREREREGGGGGERERLKKTLTPLYGQLEEISEWNILLISCAAKV